MFLLIYGILEHIFFVVLLCALFLSQYIFSQLEAYRSALLSM